MFNEVSEVTMKFFAGVFWNVTVRRRFQVIYCLHTISHLLHNKKLQQKTSTIAFTNCDWEWWNQKWVGTCSTHRIFGKCVRNTGL